MLFVDLHVIPRDDLFLFIRLSSVAAAASPTAVAEITVTLLLLLLILFLSCLFIGALGRRVEVGYFVVLFYCLLVFVCVCMLVFARSALVWRAWSFYYIMRFRKSIRIETPLNSWHCFQHMDEAFDILNSRSKFGKGFSAPLSPANHRELDSKAQELCDFLHSLRTAEGTQISRSRRYNDLPWFVAWFTLISWSSWSFWCSSGFFYVRLFMLDTFI